MAGDNFRHAVTTPTAVRQNYAVTYLRGDGVIAEIRTQATACAALHDAFCVLGRGTILQRPDGPVAVEDVMPGDLVRCRDGGFAPVLWHGRTILPPPDRTQTAPLCLTRIRADALGLGQPVQDLILGPAARLRPIAGRGNGLLQVPAAGRAPGHYIDNETFIALRPTHPVALHQLGFASDETMLVNGIGVASLQMCTRSGSKRPDMALARYRALFPHLDTLADQGVMS